MRDLARAEAAAATCFVAGVVVAVTGVLLTNVLSCDSGVLNAPVVMVLAGCLLGGSATVVVARRLETRRHLWLALGVLQVVGVLAAGWGVLGIDFARCYRVGIG